MLIHRFFAGSKSKIQQYDRVVLALIIWVNNLLKTELACTAMIANGIHSGDDKDCEPLVSI